MSSLIEKLNEKERARSEGYSVLFWKPEPGDVIEGIVEEMGETITPNGDTEYIQIQTNEDKKYMIFLNSVLKKAIVTEDVKVGDKIAIKFLGLVQSSRDKKRKFKDYILAKEDANEIEE